MRRFRFRLAGLLRLRSQLEVRGRRTLATATGAVAAVEQRIATARTGLQQCEDQGAGNGAAAALARSLALGLRRHGFRLQHELRAAEAQLERARTDWLALRHERGVLERLRERRVVEWRAATERTEQHELEELARLAGGKRVAEEHA